MLILTLIKDTALPALTSAWLRVCVRTRLSAWLTGVQRLSGVSPYLNCAAPFYCITATLARAISVEYCHQSCVAAEAWELAVNLCVCLCACVPVNLWNDKCEQCVSVCVKLLASMQCVFFCSQMDWSIQERKSNVRFSKLLYVGAVGISGAVIWGRKHMGGRGVAASGEAC